MVTNDLDNAKKQVGEQAYLHTAQAGAMVPLIQAGITGFLSGMIVFIVLFKLRVNDAWSYGLLVWLLVTTVAWFFLQWHWFSLTALEKLTGVDLNRDGTIGAREEAPPIRTVQVNVRETTPEGHLKVTVARFSIDDYRMSKLAKGLISNIPFGEDYWTGNGKLFTPKEFLALRAELLRRRLLYQVNPKSTKQGFKLTKSGRATMETLAAMMDDSSPTPPESVA